MSKIFNKDEINGKSAGELQQITQQIKQRFDQKRAFYHSLKNHFSNFESWDEFHKRLTDFDQKKYIPWNQQWANIQRGNNPQQIIENFEAADLFFNEMDSFIFSLPKANNNNSDIEQFKSEILQNIERDILSLKATILSEFERGINNLIGLKAELGLQKNFKDNIDTELVAAKKLRRNFFLSFILVILSIPFTVISTYYIELFKNIGSTELHILRIGLTISFTFLSYFLYSQYKLYQIICLRYTHLQGFLGGGATFISQLIGSENSELKQDINKKLAELFMEIELVFGLAKKSSHPTEVSIEKAGEILDKIATITGNVKK